MEDFDIAVAMAPASAFMLGAPASVHALRSRGMFRLKGGNLQVQHRGYMSAVAVNTVSSYRTRSLCSQAVMHFKPDRSGWIQEWTIRSTPQVLLCPTRSQALGRCFCLCLLVHPARALLKGVPFALCDQGAVTDLRALLRVAPDDAEAAAAFEEARRRLARNQVERNST